MARTRGRVQSLDQKARKYLDELNHHVNLNAANDCPEALKAIFLLINRTRIGIGDLNPQREEDPFNASHDYDKQLIWRAKDLSRECSAPGMNDKTEFDWQKALSPHVFFSLNNIQDEATRSERQFHHCLACCRVFRPGSRPLLNAVLDDEAQSKAEATLEDADPDQICENYRHLSLPNFVLESQLRYRFQHGPKIPDATIGICAYNLNKEPWQEKRRDLRADLRIEPFTRNYLETIFKDKTLEGPYAKKIRKEGVPLFGFVLWEAKKSEGASHRSAFVQLDDKVRSLLNWQDDIINEAAGENINTSESDIIDGAEGELANKAEGISKLFVPVVWAFTSVGSTWTVYGCYQSRNLGVNAEHFGSSVELWSGNISDENKALQLLWIVEIVKFWAEYTYKPMLGACLAFIKAHRDDQDEPPLEETSWKYHITLDEKNAPWLFHPVNSPPKKKGQHGESTEGHGRPTLGIKSLSDQSSPLSSEPLPSQTLHRSPTHDEQQIKDFTWLLDRDPMKGNLLVIRIKRDGKLDKPLILLDPEMFSRSNRRIQYPGRVPSRKGVVVDFVNKDGGIFLLQEHPNHFSSKHQFCAILPLEREAYLDSRRKSKKSSTFERLEKLLDLDGLYGLIDSQKTSHAANERSQREASSEEESDGEDSTGSYEETDEKDGSGSREETDDEDNAASLKETDEEDENESREGERAEGASDSEVDQSSDHDGSDDNSEHKDRAKTEMIERWERYLEDIHNGWEGHKWPPLTNRILTFAWAAIELGTANIKAYKDLMKMYDQVSEPPINCMTPVKGFGKSFLLLEGKNDVSKLGTQFEFLGV